MSVETPYMSQEMALQAHPQIITEMRNPFTEHTQIPDSIKESFPHGVLPPVPEVFEKAFQEPRIETKQELFTVTDIQSEITQARERLAREWENNGRGMRQYETEFDQVCFATLERFKYKAPEAYAEAKRQLEEYTIMQLKTAIRERLNASVSSWKYEIQKDGIYFDGSNEKAVDMFKRGRDFRKKHGKSVDWPREEAEVIGIEKMDRDRVTDESGEKVFDPQVGETWVSFSHRGKVKEGSIYTKNFYDIFTVKVDKQGKKYIESRRYSSSLTPEESLEKFGKFDRQNYPEDLVPTAEHFLANPFKLKPNRTPFKTADDIHAYLHKEHTAMNSEQIEIVFTQIEVVLQEYLKDPSEGKLRMVFNAADEKAGLINGKSGGSVQSLDLDLTQPITQQDMVRWQNQEVRAVDTGCGPSGLNVSVSKDGTVMGDPYSVAEFARQQKNKDNLEDYLNDPNLCRCQGEKPHFHCIGTIKKELREEGEEKVVEEPCPYKVIVGKGITKCPKCGTGKTC